MGLRNKFIAATLLSAMVAGAGVAHADDIGKLKQEAAALKKQNQALEKRLNRLEQKQSPAQVNSGPVTASTSFMAAVTSGPATLLTGEGPITWRGITLFGVVDAGLGYQSHGFPPSASMYAAPVLITKNNNHAYFGALPNGLSQSTIGLKGSEEILPGLSAVFTAATGFVPTTGRLADAPASLIAQNGLNRLNYSNNADGSRGGQAFNDQLNVGLSSQDFGTLTFGRHRNFSTDTVITYDPVGASYAFSVIGISGAAAGGGYTENVRWDDSLKYRIVYGPVHFGAMYKFADGTGGSDAGNANAPTLVFQPHNDAYQFNLGGSYANLDLDAVVGHYNQALSAGILSPAQLAGSSTFISNNNVVRATLGNINSNTLTGAITDNTNVMVAAKYTWNQFKFFAGYQHVLFTNPSESLGIGGQAQGGYALSSVNNHALGSDKNVQYFWTGVKYAYNEKFDITGAYYHLLQNAYLGAVAGSTKVVAACNNTTAPNCSGTLDAASLTFDYHFTKRFDAYAGVMWSSVNNGLASGYLYHVEWAPGVGVRYAF